MATRRALRMQRRHGLVWAFHEQPGLLSKGDWDFVKRKWEESVAKGKGAQRRIVIEDAS